MGDDSTRVLRLSSTARSTTDARRFVLSALSEWDLESLHDTAALLTSEVVTNAVLHARTDIELTVRRLEDGISIEVTDGSTRAPVRRTHLEEATTGRGIDLLEQLADDWQVDLRPDGKTVRFTISMNADPWAAYSSAEWNRRAQS